MQMKRVFPLSPIIHSHGLLSRISPALSPQSSHQYQCPRQPNTWHFGLFQFSFVFFTLLYFHFYFIFPIPHLNWRLLMTGVSNVGDDSSSLWNVQSRHVSKRTRLVCLEIHFGNFIDPSFMRHSVLALFLKGHLIKYCFQNNENRKL